MEKTIKKFHNENMGSNIVFQFKFQGKIMKLRNVYVIRNMEDTFHICSVMRNDVDGFLYNNTINIELYVCKENKKYLFLNNATSINDDNIYESYADDSKEDMLCIMSSQERRVAIERTEMEMARIAAEARAERQAVRAVAMGGSRKKRKHKSKKSRRKKSKSRRKHKKSRNKSRKRRYR